MFRCIPCALALVIASWARAACVPDVPEELLAYTPVLSHPAVLKAFERVEELLQKPYDDNVTRDALSFAIVHASSPTPIYTFNAGDLKFNETSLYPLNVTGNAITSDSIFRVASVTKNLAMASALILSRLSNHAITLDTPVRNLLPSFHLPPLDWADGGSDITLGMLASHTSGVTRESFSTNFNQVLSTGKATAEQIGALWADQTVESVVEGVGKTELMFRPGERSAYSNAGIGILGAAVASYYNEITRGNLTWSQLATQELLEPLNMTHSFIGPVFDSLIPFVTVPGGDNWADLVVGEGYDPAAGMWSSANDLAKYLHGVWLQHSPSLISPSNRRRALKPVYAFPDGKQQVGPGWEISLHTVPTSSNASKPNMTKTYSIYGKSGSGGGWQSWIDVVPNLGYGHVILSQTAGLEGYETLYPGSMYSDIQDIIVPAFAEALTAQVEMRFAGTYGSGRDTGIITDVVSSIGSNSTTYARLEVQDQILYMRELIVNGSSALEAIDRLSWLDNIVETRYFSRPEGVVLQPAGGASEVADFGEGAQVFRMTLAGEEVCNWYDYDGYKDQNGWPLTKVVLVETSNGVELRYPPFDIIVTKS
ncbi:beta-lactamase/transpeptidase-like protein [Macroventuria anomochaeta]|uniref:Beta-lactamase/transpeptidase-like protein n=1 Tax=Macroventuria anomochaeta TaxID=301207 RepID=A0ACB6RL28_9PLEO|nr:beta-lactamase/transpeptidase-like protein [Macroventuria anomochaeta]KAF2622503.1 beta-lactamase/transpeptidase-like protein [Macroventuria anomochaeta]